MVVNRMARLYNTQPTNCSLSAICGRNGYNRRMPIRLLSSEVSSQIAAGEVVERPASVVKELTENSLDAGAKNISILIADAGRILIEVADDGHGIPSDELQLAASRHATSKLVLSDDLFHIRTLGFRGEALASIGSVSNMSITSRVASAKEGARLKVDGGISSKVEKVGAPVGTVVRVENLFYNVPGCDRAPRNRFIGHALCAGVPGCALQSNGRKTGHIANRR